MGKSKSVYLNDAQEEWAKRNIKRGEFSDYVKVKIDQDIQQQETQQNLQLSDEKRSKLILIQDMVIIIAGASFFAYSFTYYIFGIKTIPSDFFLFSIVGITIELMMFFTILNIANRRKEEKRNEHSIICSNPTTKPGLNNRTD